MSEKVIKLRPQRVKGSVRSWTYGRDQGYKRDWRRAIDQSFRKKLSEREDDWLPSAS